MGIVFLTSPIAYLGYWVGFFGSIVIFMIFSGSIIFYYLRNIYKPFSKEIGLLVLSSLLLLGSLFSQSAPIVSRASYSPEPGIVANIMVEVNKHMYSPGDLVRISGRSWAKVPIYGEVVCPATVLIKNQEGSVVFSGEDFPWEQKDGHFLFEFYPRESGIYDVEAYIGTKDTPLQVVVLPSDGPAVAYIGTDDTPTEKTVITKTRFYVLPAIYGISLPCVTGIFIAVISLVLLRVKAYARYVQKSSQESSAID